MKTKLLPVTCVLLIVSTCLLFLKTSETVIAAPPLPEAAILQADKIQLELSNGKSVFLTKPQLVEVGGEIFIAGNDSQSPKKIRYLSLRHTTELVGFTAVSE